MAVTGTYDSRNKSGGDFGYGWMLSTSTIQKIDGTGTTNYLVDSNRTYAEVLEERDASGTVLARYDYGDDLIRMDRGSSTRYYLFDGLGSTRQLTDGTGAVTDTYAYDAFGNLVAQTGSTVNPYLFNGQDQDAGTGLYYLRARYMNPQDGRFTSQDPYGGDDEDPISLHRYLYVAANPVNMVDPNGEDGDEESTLVSTGISIGLDSLRAIGIVGLGTALIGGGTFAASGGSPVVGGIVGFELGASLAYAYTTDRGPEAALSAAVSGAFSLVVDAFKGWLSGNFKHKGSPEYIKQFQTMYQHMFEAAASGAATAALGSFKHQDRVDKALTAAALITIQDLLDDANAYTPGEGDKTDTLTLEIAQIAFDAGLTYSFTYLTSLGLDSLSQKEVLFLRSKLVQPSEKVIEGFQASVEISLDGVLGAILGTTVDKFIDSAKEKVAKEFE